MRDRRIARCSNTTCNETFSYLIDISEEQLQQNPVILLNCPFCATALRIDLNPYLTKTTTVYRDGENTQTQNWELPEELPTQLAKD